MLRKAKVEQHLVLTSSNFFAINLSLSLSQGFVCIQYVRERVDFISE